MTIDAGYCIIEVYNRKDLIRMSHFYAAISKSARKTTPTARGHRSTGIETVTQSFNGQIRTVLWYDAVTNQDMYKVILQPHGTSSHDGLVLATGAINC